MVGLTALYFLLTPFPVATHYGTHYGTIMPPIMVATLISQYQYYKTP